jgi:hypothetical protein
LAFPSFDFITYYMFIHDCILFSGDFQVISAYLTLISRYERLSSLSVHRVLYIFYGSICIVSVYYAVFSIQCVFPTNHALPHCYNIMR